MSVGAWELGDPAVAQAVLEALDEAVVVLDTDGRIADWSPGAERLFGWSKEEVSGKALQTLYPDGERPRLAEGSQEGVWHVRRDGTRFRGSTRTLALRDDGKLLGYARVVRELPSEAIERALGGLRALIDASPLAIIALDTEGRIEFWNPAAEALFGWREAEVLGTEEPIVPPSEQQAFREHLQRVLSGGHPPPLDAVRVTRDGRLVLARISSAPLEISGQVRGALRIVEDVTEVRAAEEAQRRLNAILEATPDVVATTDLEGHVLYLNRAGRQMLGVTEIVGRTLLEWMPDHAARTVLREGIPTAMRHGVWQGDSALIASGTERPFSQVIVAHRGEPTYLSTILRDISERKRAEGLQTFLSEASRRLSRSLAREEIAGTVCDLLVPQVADYCIVDLATAEGRFERAVLRHADPGRQALLDELRRFPPRASGPFGVERTLRTGEPEHLAHVTGAWLRAVSRDEAHLEVLRALQPSSEVIVPICAGGRVLGAITCACDGSGRSFDREDMRLAEDLAGRAGLALDNARLYAEVQGALRTRDEVLRIVAHDLRNPISTVSLAATALIRALPPEGTPRDLVERIRRSATLADGLVRDLLEVARIEAGRLAVEPVPHDAGALVSEARDLHASQAEARRVTLETILPDALPPVLADRPRVLQVFSNLIGNALRVTPEGGRITISAEPGEDVVRFVVSDTGPGIEPEHLPRLFEPFWQSRQRAGGGAGLGLAICRGIIEAHAGRIGVQSPPGEGATFWFSLPRHESD